MEHFNTKDLIWMRTNIQEFKDPPEEYKEVLAKLDQTIIASITSMRTHRMELT